MPTANGVLEIAADTGTLNAYSLSPANINVAGFSSQVIADPANNLLWFTEPGAIGVFSLSTHTVTNQISLPTTGGTQVPADLTVGPDGNIWFTESAGTSSAVGVIYAQTRRLCQGIRSLDFLEARGNHGRP